MDAGRKRSLIPLGGLKQALMSAHLHRIRGRVVEVVGPLVEAELPGATVGGLCRTDNGQLCECVGFRGQRALMMPLEASRGITFGTSVELVADALAVPVGNSLIGRVVDGLGVPMDGKGPIVRAEMRSLRGPPPDPMRRRIIREPLHTGVRVIDGLLTLGKGQRIAVTAGSGVGKSTLLGMLTRHVTADVNVICLVGERGREVREFVEDNLGPEGLARSVVVAATSDRSPALQIKAAFLATTIAEYFRDQGKSVLLMLDSLTRLALAQRQIGLAAGEPPTTRGYTPSVFALLPPLLERAGPGIGVGSITAVYTVLVEGDDENDPIGDAVRGIVDGHIVLSRKIAHTGQYPAVDVLHSLSRLMTRVSTEPHQKLAVRFRDLLSTWQDNEELVRLGAWRRGAAPDVDAAVDAWPKLRAFLAQPPTQANDPEQTLLQLAEAVAPQVAVQTRRS
jgi:flagellum-specific ATP synthase